MCLPQVLQIPPTDHWAKGYVISSIIEAPAHVLICLLGLIRRCVGPQNPKPSCSHVLPACRSSQILFLFAFREHVAAHLSTGRETISLVVSTVSRTLIMVCFCSVIHHQSPVCLRFNNNKARRPLQGWPQMHQMVLSAAIRVEAWYPSTHQTLKPQVKIWCGRIRHYWQRWAFLGFR